MALCNFFLLLLIVSSLSLSVQGNRNFNKLKPSLKYSFSFPLTSHRLSHPDSPATLLPSLVSATRRKPNPNPGSLNKPSAYKSSFKYSVALIVSLPIGTPPQSQSMVLDTGSQLSWIQCHNKTVAKLPPASFDPSLSSTFSVLPCNHPLCKPRIPDFTLPTDCDQNRLCHYSYFYADGTLAEGNLVREKITFSRLQSTPPLILGCARDTGAAEGILGMNLGRLSFSSQAKISKFSYCVPLRRKLAKVPPVGTFYLGENPYSGGFRYVDLLTFDRSQSQQMPNFDAAAYTVVMEGIRIGGKRLNISRAVFRPDPSGAGQTMIDSGTEYTFLMEDAYVKVREEIVRLVGPSKVKQGYVYGGALDLCFNGDPVAMGRPIGDVVLEMEKGVEIVVEKEKVFTDVGSGVHCLSIGRSQLLGVESNIIGNVHQQNLWVEFDLVNRRVGFGRAECNMSA
ncbi:PREDICTED: aspartic proteinase PCS1-like [Nelumbo nucifera]|uniref:Aspartic proteinase PCS1-like n=1 Tax=Nelumbo nucifera TaxID=4432 RepID=A0A1U8B659_NELNU|nr:PREDICTED: aspartic proteinase PCS1-like [Nelumbo nucifera]